MGKNDSDDGKMLTKKLYWCRKCTPNKKFLNQTNLSQHQKFHKANPSNSKIVKCNNCS